jgi:uncharacterized membrane protein
MVQQGKNESVMEVTPLQHTLSTIALCACALAHYYLLISVSPYPCFMAIEQVPSANEENAGSYAGLIGSAFMIGILGSLGTVAVYFLLHEPDEEEDYVEMKS